MRKVIRDHLGNEFPHVTAMLRHWKIHPMVYARLKERGCTLKQILDKNFRPKYEKPKKPKIEPVDHKGIRYSSVKEMCSKYHIDKNTFLARHEQGLSLRECLLGEDDITRLGIVARQANYADLLQEIDRLEKRLNALKKNEEKLQGISTYATEKLIDKINEAGVAISNVVSYANGLIAASR